jgi:hypothetical protein
VKIGDLVEVIPDFLDYDDFDDFGVILRKSTWDEGYSHDSWVVFRGMKFVHHPPDTIRVVREK